MMHGLAFSLLSMESRFSGSKTGWLFLPVGQEGTGRGMVHTRMGLPFEALDHDSGSAFLD